MARKKNWCQGIFKPSDESKYIGKQPIKYKSQWELTFMNFCDNNKHVKSWAYEPIKIPYFNPIKKKQSIYIPDFLIEYYDAKGQHHVEMIEIKPHCQAYLTEKTSRRNRLQITINHAKWKEVVKWCKHRNIVFRVITQEELYR